MKVRKRFSEPFKATIGFTISNILQKGIMFLVVPIYTRILSTEQYGNYSVFLSWLEIFEIITTFRISWGGYVVGLNKYEHDRDRYTASLQSLSIIITSFFLLIYILFRNYINQLTGMTSEMTLLMFVLMYALPAIKFWTVRERVDYKYKAVLIVTSLTSAAIVILGTVGALMANEKDLAVIVARVLVQGILGIVLIIYNYKGKFVIYDKAYWQRTLRFNIPLLPYYLSMVILNSSDRIIISNLVGKSAAGIYSVAYTISTCMQLISTSINGVMQTWLYERMKKNELNRVPEIIQISLEIIALLNLLVIGLAPEIISIVAPAQYQEAVWVLPPLAASVVIMFFYQHFVNIEFYFENSRLTAVASCGAAVLNIVLNLIFIPKYGYLAAGYTTLISYFVFGISHYFFMKRICKKKNYTGNIIDIGKMLGTLMFFGGVAAIEMVGYCYSITRYIVMLILVILCIIMFYLKKEKIFELIGTRV